MSKGNISNELQNGHHMLYGSATWDIASTADGNDASTDVTVTGAELGDYVIGVSLEVDVTDLIVSAQVTADDVVTVVVANCADTTIDPISTTVNVLVMKKEA